MLHHVELNVSNLVESKSFYSKLLPPLGYSLFQEWEKGFSYKVGSTYLVFVQTEEKFLQHPYHRKETGLNHLAFHASSRAQVDEMTEKMQQLGARILYQDLHPYAGGPDYYAVFFEGPDRLKIEIVAPNETISND
ncbi:MAG: VOC family protein [Planococcus sp. (in: firmicutes)]|uniref:VOC family protein n=1 Tax=Planococcus halocryophilus TaxID=1215089 RepID=UPI001F113259|nr:VOC family protein [Planococcus halocryophilus]MCH4825987.1 VOC family protein [Planococcus halocryophilus]